MVQPTTWSARHHLTASAGSSGHSGGTSCCRAISQHSPVMLHGNAPRQPQMLHVHAFTTCHFEGCCGLACRGLWRGTSPTMARLSLGLALNFLVLENVKSALLEYRRNRKSSSRTGRFPHLPHANACSPCICDVHGIIIGQSYLQVAAASGCMR